jgi:protein O-GlcNAc transferase
MALTYDKASWEAHTNLGNLLREDAKLAEAMECYRAALASRPDSAETLNNLALCLADTGKLDEAESAYRAALALRPRLAEARSNLLFCLCYRDDLDFERLCGEHRVWGAVHGQPIDKQYSTYFAPATPDRKLRIGYVSPDLRAHSVAYFLEPILQSHNRDAFEPVCYSQAEVEDATSERLRGHVSLWRQTSGVSDQSLAAMIHEDAIDILVDLAGHTGGNRLAAFAFKPAPVQATYCGYPCTTGLSAIDYRITDATADPPGEDGFYSEKLVHLDGCFLCYAPPAQESSPRPHGSAVVFASFNTLQKLSASVIRVWAAIVRSVPNSRLLLKRAALDDAETRSRITKLFGRHGIGPEQLELHGHEAQAATHLQWYNRADICLDTFPYNGTTTTCEALWMGVPTLTLAGRHHMQRVSLSILKTIGLEELVAYTEEEYIAKAVALARDLGKLAPLRHTLRRRMAQSPLCDAQGFTRKFEAGLRRMWLDWCTKQQ